MIKQNRRGKCVSPVYQRLERRMEASINLRVGVYITQPTTLNLVRAMLAEAEHHILLDDDSQTLTAYLETILDHLSPASSSSCYDLLILGPGESAALCEFQVLQTLSRFSPCALSLSSYSPTQRLRKSEDGCNFLWLLCSQSIHCRCLSSFRRSVNWPISLLISLSIRIKGVMDNCLRWSASASPRGIDG